MYKVSLSLNSLSFTEQQLRVLNARHALEAVLTGATRDNMDLLISLDNAGIILGKGSYVVIYMNLIDQDSNKITKSEQTRLSLLESLMEIAVNEFHGKGILYPVIIGNSVVCIRHYSRNDASNTSEQVFTNATAAICDKIIERFNNSFHFQTFYIISRFVFSESALHEAYMRCRSICDYSIFSGNITPVLECAYLAFEDYSAHAVHSINSFAHEICVAIQSQDATLLNLMPDRIVDFLQSQCYPAMHYFRWKLQTLLISIQAELPYNSAAGSSLDKIVEFLYFSDSLADLKDTLSAYFYEISNTIVTQAQIRLSGKSGPIKTYIMANYDDLSLSVASIASHFHISQAYLSTFFHEVESCTVSEFINRTRANVAKMLLESSEDTIAEIIRKSGFSSRSTFQRALKKYYNATATELRISK